METYEPIPGRTKRLRKRKDLSFYEAEDGREYVYRPRELVVAAGDVEIVRDKLPKGSRPIEGGREVGVVRFRLPASADVPELVSRLRKPPPGERIPRAGPNHVFFGEPAYHGGPATTARPALEPRWPREKLGQRVTVAVLDTGISPHPRIARRTRDTPGDDAEISPILRDPAPDDLDIMDVESDGCIDDEAGHGTFVAGVVLQAAPRATVLADRVIDSHGVGDDFTVARGIWEARRAHVINLSLGTYTHDNMAPVAITEVLDRIGRETVLVAAAGNNDTNRPFWPAALKRVIAVAALDQAGTGKAGFSNYGWWVDACAIGEDVVSTFVKFDGSACRGAPAHLFDMWAVWSGTSFAAPRVAGAIAAVTSHLGVSARQAADLLLNGPGLRRIPDLGAVLDLPAALAGAVPGALPRPAYHGG